MTHEAGLQVRPFDEYVVVQLGDAVHGTVGVADVLLAQELWRIAQSDGSIVQLGYTAGFGPRRWSTDEVLT